MKHALIVAHPNAESFNLTVARAYETAAKSLGQTVVVRDLYRMNFEPRLAATEIPGPAGFSPGADVVAERQLIGDADVFAFVYPLWLDAPPAILKGYLERVFGMGFAYEAVAGANEPLLKGRMMVSLSSSGAPESWLRQTGAWDANHRLFDQYFCELTGLAHLGRLHFGGVTAGMTEASVAACVADVQSAVEKHFGPAD